MVQATGRYCIGMGQEIQYPVANNESGDLIKAEEAQSRRPYFCVECGKEMVHKSGPKVRPHFAHKDLGQNCSVESALHYGFKKLLYQRISMELGGGRVVPIGWNCKSCWKWNKGNLLTINGREAVHIEDECHLGACRPDIALLTKDKEVVVAIEVVVTHRPEQSAIKFYRERGIAMVQFNLELDADLSLATSVPLVPDVLDIVDICTNRKCRNCRHYGVESALDLVVEQERERYDRLERERNARHFHQWEESDRLERESEAQQLLQREELDRERNARQLHQREESDRLERSRRHVPALQWLRMERPFQEVLKEDKGEVPIDKCGDAPSESLPPIEGCVMDVPTVPAAEPDSGTFGLDRHNLPAQPPPRLCSGDPAHLAPPAAAAANGIVTTIELVEAALFHLRLVPGQLAVEPVLKHLQEAGSGAPGRGQVMAAMAQLQADGDEGQLNLL